MIRRAIRIFFYIAAGWIIMTLPLLALLRFPGTEGFHAGLLLIMAGVSAALLAGGAWASTGRRRWEAGLVILIATGFALLSGASIVLVLNDPLFAKVLSQDSLAAMKSLNNYMSCAVTVASLLAGGLALMRVTPPMPRRPISCWQHAHGAKLG